MREGEKEQTAVRHRDINQFCQTMPLSTPVTEITALIL